MYREDIELAVNARFNACSPYSNFEVGAALRTKDGKQSFKAVSNEFLLKYHN